MDAGNKYDIDPSWNDVVKDGDCKDMLDLLGDESWLEHSSLWKHQEGCSTRASSRVSHHPIPLLPLPWLINIQRNSTTVYEYDKTWKMKNRPNGLTYGKRKKKNAVAPQKSHKKRKTGSATAPMTTQG